LRGSYATARPLEYGHLNTFFELANATAERRLPKQQSLSRPPKTPVVRSRNGISEMLQVDN